MYEIRYKAKTCQAYLMLGALYWMLDAGYWSERSGDPENSGILDLRCHPGGIFAVVGKIMVLDVAILMLDIGCWRSIPP
jgi:hypothetical protein